MIKHYRSGLTTKIRRTKDKAYGKDWLSLRQSIVERDRNICKKCGGTVGLEVHHIIPISKGGRNIQANLITLCKSCHKNQPGHNRKKWM